MTEAEQTAPNPKVEARALAIELAQYAVSEAEAVSPEFRSEFWNKLFSELYAVSPLIQHQRHGRRPVIEVNEEEANERYKKLSPQVQEQLERENRRQQHEGNPS